jgi:hypothetical protein
MAPPVSFSPLAWALAALGPALVAASVDTAAAAQPVAAKLAADSSSLLSSVWFYPALFVVSALVLAALTARTSFRATLVFAYSCFIRPFISGGKQNTHQAKLEAFYSSQAHVYDTTRRYICPPQSLSVLLQSACRVSSRTPLPVFAANFLYLLGRLGIWGGKKTAPTKAGLSSWQLRGSAHPIPP